MIVVSGAPASGKTTLAREISALARLPLLAKDELKEAIADETRPPADVTESQKLGLAAYRILFLLAWRLADAGSGFVLESNFRRGVSEPEIQRLLGCTDGRLVHCTAADDLVMSRYVQRHQRGDRHAAHRDSDRRAALQTDLAAGRFEPLSIDCPVLVVRTDDGYDPGLAEILAFASQ
jgi:predicted kinase